MAGVIAEILILVVLLALSGFFSGSETALTTVSQVKMKTMAREGSRRAEEVLRVTAEKDKMLSAILIGNNVVNLSASSLATTLATRLLGSFGAGIATGILTFLILIFGEITPKNHAQMNNTAQALRCARTIRYLMWILTPAIFVVNHISGGILKLLHARNEGDQAITEEELRTIVDESRESGVIEPNEQRYIHNLFDFSDATAKEVMIPRIDVTMVNVNWSFERLMQVIREEMLTRMPVYEGDTDHVIGIINVKDLLADPPKKPFSIRNYMREAYFTYEQKNSLDLFQEMRKNSIAMAIVLDEYGAVVGLITLEDLLEELVGEIRDEYDADEEDDITQLSDREFIVKGSANLEDLCETLPLGFSSEDYDTLGGYLTGLFDHVPEVGETYVTKEGILLRVIKTGHQRIEKVRIRFPKPVKKKD